MPNSLRFGSNRSIADGPLPARTQRQKLKVQCSENKFKYSEKEQACFVLFCSCFVPFVSIRKHFNETTVFGLLFRSIDMFVQVDVLGAGCQQCCDDTVKGAAFQLAPSQRAACILSFWCMHSDLICFSHYQVRHWKWLSRILFDRVSPRHILVCPCHPVPCYLYMFRLCMSHWKWTRLSCIDFSCLILQLRNGRALSVVY